MAIIFFAQTLFGILSVMRTHQIFRARALLTTSFVTKSGTIFVSFALFSAILCVKSEIFALIAITANIFCSFATLIWCERREIDALKSEIPLFLDRWILNLRLGSAVSQARERALSEQTENFQTLLRPIFATATAKTGHPIVEPALLHEFERIERESHSALSRIENLRRNLRKAADFRRKSGQAALQTRVQCLVMLVLQIALSVFTVRQFGWGKCGDLVFWSAALSFAGFGATQILARKTRWKV